LTYLFYMGADVEHTQIRPISFTHRKKTFVGRIAGRKPLSNTGWGRLLREGDPTNILEEPSNDAPKDDVGVQGTQIRGTGTCGLMMATSSEDLVKLEVKTISTPRHSHHKARHRMKLAARIALILGLVVGFVAISDFAYNAYKREPIVTRTESPTSGGLRCP
jgi:hypothetical protein